MLFTSWNKETLKVYTLGVDNRWADNIGRPTRLYDVFFRSIFYGNQVL